MCDNDPRCTAPHPDDLLAVLRHEAQRRAWLDHRLSEHGYAVQQVLGDHRSRQPGFAYTIGLTQFDHPEILVIGLADDRADRLLGELARQVILGEHFRAGDEVASDVRPRVRLLRLPNPEHILFVAQAEFRDPGGPPVPALQAVYSDSAGRYPWEAGYRDTRWLQPLPGRFAA